MLKGLVAFVMVAAGWVAALWFGVAPDFAQWSLPQLLAMHVLPPLFASGSWLGWRRWRAGRAEARARVAEAAAEKEQAASIEEARKQAAAEVQRRCFGCDCRVVAMAQVLSGEDEAPLADEGVGVYFSSFDPSEAEVADGTSLVAHLRPGIEEALAAIYGGNPAAASLPVYVALPGRARADEFVSTVLAAQHALTERDDVPQASAREFGRVYQLADGKHALDGIIELFERTLGLAAVVLGSDSPWLHARLAGDEEDTATEAGKPGQGVFALLLTHPELANADSDIPLEKREALLSLPVLARLHRPAHAEAGGRRMRANDLARAVGGLMAQARRNAGIADAGKDEELDKQESGPDCNWLVHNSGTPASGGARMAGVGAALLDQGIDLDPFDEATNISTAAGDLGDARGVGMLALAVVKAAVTQGAALGVEFCGNEALSLFVARAPESGEQALA